MSASPTGRTSQWLCAGSPGGYIKHRVYSKYGFHTHLYTNHTPFGQKSKEFTRRKCAAAAIHEEQQVHIFSQDIIYEYKNNEIGDTHLVLSLARLNYLSSSLLDTVMKTMLLFLLIFIVLLRREQVWCWGEMGGWGCAGREMCRRKNYQANTDTWPFNNGNNYIT